MYTICICEDPAREEADGRMVMNDKNEAASAAPRAPSAPVVSATSVVCFHKE